MSQPSQSTKAYIFGYNIINYGQIWVQSLSKSKKKIPRWKKHDISLYMEKTPDKFICVF